MSDFEQKFRWLTHVMTGKGKDRSASRTENLNYRGTVLFRGEWPVSRVIKGHAPDTWVCISRTGEFINESANKHIWPGTRSNLRVPCVGVFTWVPGDMVPEGDELNERMNWLWTALAGDIIDTAQTMPGYLMFPERMQPRDKAAVETEMHRAVEQHSIYGKLVARWDTTAMSSLLDRFNEVMEKRRSIWWSVKEVEKRERTEAKREARKALQI